MSIRYCSHIQDIGWQNYVNEGEISGTTGLSKRMEAIKIDFYHPHVLGIIEYSVHVQNIGWMEFVGNNEVAGTTGQSLRIEAVKIRLTGDSADMYDIYYQCHVQNIGWMGWAKNGEEAGTTGYAYRCEAIKIVLVFKNDPAPGSTEDRFRVNPNLFPQHYMIPVKYIGISQGFRDIDTNHYGVDFGYSTDPNMPIFSATNGVADIVDNVYGGGKGYYIRIKYIDYSNNRTIYTYYEHLSVFNISQGNEVTVGQQIALMGDTGNVGPHLHFTMIIVNGLDTPYTDTQSNRASGAAVDPLLYCYIDDTYSIGNETIENYSFLRV